MTRRVRGVALLAAAALAACGDGRGLPHVTPVAATDGRRVHARGAPPARFVRSLEAGRAYDVACRVPPGGRARFVAQVPGAGGPPLLDALHAATGAAPLLIEHRLVVPGRGGRRPVVFSVRPAPGVAGRFGLPEPWRPPPAGASFAEPLAVPPLRGRSLDPAPDLVLSLAGTLLPALARDLDALRRSGYAVVAVDGTVRTAAASPARGGADRVIAAEGLDVTAAALDARRRFGERGPYALVLLSAAGEPDPAPRLRAELAASGLLARTDVASRPPAIR